MLLDPDPDPHPITDQYPDPGQPDQYGSMRIRIHNTACSMFLGSEQVLANSAKTHELLASILLAPRADASTVVG